MFVRIIFVCKFKTNFITQYSVHQPHLYTAVTYIAMNVGEENYNKIFGKRTKRLFLLLAIDNIEIILNGLCSVICYVNSQVVTHKLHSL